MKCSRSAVVLAAFLFLVFLTASRDVYGASTCYDASHFPSIWKIEKLDSDGIRVYLQERKYKALEKGSPILEYRVGQGWSKAGRAPCDQWSCAPKEQGCSEKLPRINLTHDEVMVLDPDAAAIPEQRVSACHQVGDVIWFGIGFYSGEGFGGVGGVGRYDLKTKTMEIRRPTILRRSSVTHLYFEDGRLWLGTGGSYECIGTPPTEGLVQYDWRSGQVTTYRDHRSDPCGFTVHGIVRTSEGLWVATDLGLSLARVPAQAWLWENYVPDFDSEELMSRVQCEQPYVSLLEGLSREHTELAVNYGTPWHMFFENLRKFRPSFLAEYYSKHSPRSEVENYQCDGSEGAAIEFLRRPISSPYVRLTAEEDDSGGTILKFFENLGIEPKITDTTTADRGGPVEVRRWEIKGLSIEGFVPFYGPRGSSYVIGNVVITNPKIDLACGLHIGDPMENFVKALGKPTTPADPKESSVAGVHSYESWWGDVGSVTADLTTTDDGNVEKIEFTIITH